MTERQSDTPNHFSQAEKMVGESRSFEDVYRVQTARIAELERLNAELRSEVSYETARADDIRSTAAVKLDELRGVIAEKEADVAKVIRARNEWEDTCRVAVAEVETLKRTVREVEAERDAARELLLEARERLYDIGCMSGCAYEHGDRVTMRDHDKEAADIHARIDAHLKDAK